MYGGAVTDNNHRVVRDTRYWGKSLNRNSVIGYTCAKEVFPQYICNRSMRDRDTVHWDHLIAVRA